MRLMPASRAASLRLVKVRTMPIDSTLKVAASEPVTARSTAAAAALKVLCPDVYDWKLGVVSKGSHAASPAVASLPSASASRMAVIGRQKPKVFLHSHALMAASACAMPRRANIRADSSMPIPREVATCCAMRFQAPGGVIVPAPKAHTRAMSVCSAVRSVLVAEPRRRTCSNDAAYVALATDGGAAGRNCEGDDSPKGVHEAICANAPGK